MELLGLECGGTFCIQTSLLNISHLLRKMRFVLFVLSTLYLENFTYHVNLPLKVNLGSQVNNHDRHDKNVELQQPITPSWSSKLD